MKYKYHKTVYVGCTLGPCTTAGLFTGHIKGKDSEKKLERTVFMFLYLAVSSVFPSDFLLQIIKIHVSE